jgi:hypothetical protein
MLRLVLELHPPLPVKKTLRVCNWVEDGHTLNSGFFQCLMSIGTSATPTKENLITIFLIKGSTDPKEEVKA